jgi:hypothetical protein
MRRGKKTPKNSTIIGWHSYSTGSLGEKMIQFIVDYHKQIITTSGLLFDIIGAILVAIEVVDKFKGQEYIDPGDQYLSGPAIKMDAFLKWEKRKFFIMSVGLVLLVIGFILQIVSAWL